MGALAAGALDEARAKILVDVLQFTYPAVARQVENRLLPEATGLSTGRLKAKALALLLELDADAVDARRKDAKRQADVRTYPSHQEGVATLAAELPADEAAEAYDLIDQLAQMAKADGDDRPVGQLRAEVCSLLLRRPAGHGLPDATANVTVTAALDALEGGAATPGSVSGLPITAAHVRELLQRIGALGLRAGGRVADPGAHRPPQAGGTPSRRPAARRRRRRPAGPAGPPRLPAAPRWGLRLPGAGPATGHPGV